MEKISESKHSTYPAVTRDKLVKQIRNDHQQYGLTVDELVEKYPYSISHIPRLLKNEFCKDESYEPPPNCSYSPKLARSAVVKILYRLGFRQQAIGEYLNFCQPHVSNLLKMDTTGGGCRDISVMMVDDLSFHDGDELVKLKQGERVTLRKLDEGYTRLTVIKKNGWHICPLELLIQKVSLDDQS